MPYEIQYPSDFLMRETSLLGNRFAELLHYKTEQPARGLTVNALRCTPGEFANQADFPLVPSAFCPAAFSVNADFKPGRHPYHHGGSFYAQEPSAAAPAALLEVQPGQWVADLCAAPGGKSGQLAAALQGQGLLLSNEYVPARAEVLRQNLERLGAANAIVTNADTAALAAALPAAFDRVLVDTPCSGEGMFRKEPAAIGQHDNALVAHCAALGAEILENAAALLAPGGILVYSTCTFAPAEDEGQVAAFLAKHPEFTLCDLSAVGFGRPGEVNRIAPEQADNAAEVAAKTRRIWPADGGEGHFMAKLQKVGESTPHAALLGGKPLKSAKPPQEWQNFAAETFPQLAKAPLQAVGDWLSLPPADLGLLPKNIRVLRSGVLAGSVQKRRFVPAHALFMAYGTTCANTEALTLADPRTAAWLRGEEIEAATAHNGWCAVLVDGMPLGGGKASGGRIKNHYPKALRNLK